MNMQTASAFSDYYKTITDAELLSILENKEDYQEGAIEAAEQELKSRQFSAARLEELKMDLAQANAEKEEAKQRYTAVEGTVKRKFNDILESLNPIHKELPGAEKPLRFIIVLWGLLTLYQMINDYKFEFSAIKEFPFHPFVNSTVLFPYIILPISIFLLWKRKPSGWSLFVIYLTYQLAAEISMFYYAVTWKPSGVEWMDQLFKPSIPKIVLRFLFVSGTFYTMCSKNMRQLFLIERKKMFATIVITLAIAVLLFIGLMNQ